MSPFAACCAFFLGEFKSLFQHGVSYSDEVGSVIAQSAKNVRGSGKGCSALSIREVLLGTGISLPSLLGRGVQMSAYINILGTVWPEN
jgi:hypothetical protein